MDVNQMKLFALLSRAMGGQVKPRQIGDGQRRAQERLAAKRKANAATYKDMPERLPSRQVLRAQARAQNKANRSRVKQAAMREKWPGGSAVVR